MNEITEMMPYIISALTFIFAIYKFQIEFIYKRNFKDFDQISKFILQEKNWERLQKQKPLVQDAFCRTISYFRSYSFEQVEQLIASGVPLSELIVVTKLNKNKLLSYKDNKFFLRKEPKLSLKGYKFLYIILFLILFIIGTIIQSKIDTIQSAISLLVLMAFTEICLLLKFELDKFKYEFKEMEHKINSRQFTNIIILK
ncbi:hypothetical protein [Mannheimia sp. ZY171111]|uniref:hypothetical protein n=1 Tax=Mannheimia sp. ZY171111 TaxID=2679995 RepID=UPI001ADD8D5D|nr:hypothetical protein [Mannheimia sp. ZY171111]QTM00677.1 hypothetical protein GM698_03160 [Mannheimia sp. ZY171111]